MPPAPFLGRGTAGGARAAAADISALEAMARSAAWGGACKVISHDIN